MASPFSIFRKYSGGLMVVMVVLSMLLFTLTDLFTDPTANLWLLGLLVGGTVFGIAGIGQGRWLQWGIGGAILGSAMGFILPGFVDKGGLDTSLGVIGEEEMYELELRRNIANQFVFRATEASFGEGMGRFARVFGFGHTSPREDVIFGKLLRAEADRLGIMVSDEMVTDYVNVITSDKLTKEDYIETRNALSYKNQRMNDDMLLSILGDELKAQMAFQLLRPRTASLPPGPEVYWQYFRRLHVRQQVEVAALDVDEFLDDVEEPADTEVEETFAKYAKKFPNQDEPGTPGFRMPFRARLAWVELDSQSVKADVEEVTDEDIQKYYDENKETPLIKRPVMPDFDDDKKPADPKPAEAEAEEKEKPSPEENKKPGDNKPDDEKAGPEKEKQSDPKSAEEKSGEAKPENTESEKEAAEAKTPEANKSADGEARPTEESEKSKADESKEQATEKEADDGSCESFVADEEADTKSESDSSADATDEKTPEEKPAAEGAKSEAATTEAAAKDEKPEAAADKPGDPVPAAVEKSEEKPDGEKPEAKVSEPSSLDIPALPQIKPAEMKDPPEPQYEYRELNDELKDEIREELVRQRVKAAVDAKMKDVTTQMDTLASQRSKHRFSKIEEDPSKFEGDEEEKEEALQNLKEELRPYDEDVSLKLKKYAESKGLVYVETPLISYTDLMGEDYPIGRATKPVDNPMFAPQLPPVAQTVFQAFSADLQNNEAQIFQPRAAQRSSESGDGETYHYVYWTFDYSTAHVPELSEEGVRESVVKAIKRLKARDLAVKRGEELAETVRKGLSKTGEEKVPMAASLKDATVTGSEDAPAVSVRTSRPFAWLKASTASPMSFQQQPPTMSRIEFDDGSGPLERIGPKFMEAVFTDMVDEEVKVVPNFDLSKYYVVHVTNRFPTPEIGEDGLRDRFANEGKQFSFASSPIIGIMQQELAGPASLAWEKALWRRYGIEPDADPDEE